MWLSIETRKAHSSPMTLIPLLVLALAHAEGTTTPAELLGIVNIYRQTHGVDPLTIHEQLCKVADGHAGFMFQNHVLSHFEQPEMKGFTGVNLASRAAKVNWTDELSELVGYANTGLQDSVQAIFDSPSHRVRFLKPGKLTLGAGAQGDFVCLLVGGEPAKQTVVSPPDGATNVPTRWFGSSDLSGTKTGIGGRVYGYPLVFMDTCDPNFKFKTLTAELSGPDNEPVPVILRDPENDEHYSCALTMIPERALLPGVAYSARVIVQFGVGKPKETTWKFQTSGKKSG